MFRMYLDEHGVDRMTRLDLDKYRYLSLTGVVMKVTHARDFLLPAFNNIKAEVFNEDPDSPICFHRSDIRQNKGPFEPLRDVETRARFDELIIDVFRKTEFTAITVLIDKQALSEKHYWDRTHPYHVLMEVLVEKYAQFLHRVGSIGDIMPEARSKPQDKALQSEFLHYKEHGTRFASKELIHSHIPSSNLKFRTKKNNVAGLQLCDLIAHPSHYAIRKRLGHDVRSAPFASKVVNILAESKYDRSASGKIWGYGVKHIV